MRRFILEVLLRLTVELVSGLLLVRWAAMPLSRDASANMAQWAYCPGESLGSVALTPRGCTAYRGRGWAAYGGAGGRGGGAAPLTLPGGLRRLPSPGAAPLTLPGCCTAYPPRVLHLRLRPERGTDEATDATGRR